MQNPKYTKPISNHTQRQLKLTIIIMQAVKVSKDYQEMLNVMLDLLITLEIYNLPPLLVYCTL